MRRSKDGHVSDHSNLPGHFLIRSPYLAAPFIDNDQQSACLMDSLVSPVSAHKPFSFIRPIHIALRGHALLSNARFNKGTGFSLSERTALGLKGRLPYKTNTLEQQCERAYEQLLQRDTPIRKNSFLQSLKEQNWTLYYALLARHLRELVPVIYTPTEVSYFIPLL